MGNLTFGSGLCGFANRIDNLAKMLLRLIKRKFGPPSEPVRARITQADPDTLLTGPSASWSPKAWTRCCIEMLVTNGARDDAVSRADYAAFHAVSALHLSQGNSF